MMSVLYDKLTELVLSRLEKAIRRHYPCRLSVGLPGQTSTLGKELRDSIKVMVDSPSGRQ